MKDYVLMSDTDDKEDSLPDSVIIPRAEYNNLIAAKAAMTMILATSDQSGYGCAEIVKGFRKIDRYCNALDEAAEKFNDLVKKHDTVVEEYERNIHDLKAQLVSSPIPEPAETGSEVSSDA